MKLTIFDLDNTILKGDSDYSWINYLIDLGKVDKKIYEEKNQYFYDKYYEGDLDYDEWAEFALSTIKGKSPDQIDELISDFMIKIIEPMINIYALRLIHDHNHEHDIMLLASATNSVIVEPIAKRLGFQNIISSDAEICDGVYTGKILGAPALGEGKLKKVEEWAYKKNISITDGSTFYSDSINDFPLLNVVENPVAVNPDNQLREISIKNSWKIIDLP